MRLLRGYVGTSIRPSDKRSEALDEGSRGRTERCTRNTCASCRGVGVGGRRLARRGRLLFRPVRRKHIPLQFLCCGGRAMPGCRWLLGELQLSTPLSRYQQHNEHGHDTMPKPRRTGPADKLEARLSSIPSYRVRQRERTTVNTIPSPEQGRLGARAPQDSEPATRTSEGTRYVLRHSDARHNAPCRLQATAMDAGMYQRRSRNQRRCCSAVEARMRR
jgi:hypothetical protein